MKPYIICNSEIIMYEYSVPSHEKVFRPTTLNFEDVCPIASQTYFLT